VEPGPPFSGAVIFLCWRGGFHPARMCQKKRRGAPFYMVAGASRSGVWRAADRTSALRRRGASAFAKASAGQAALQAISFAGIPDRMLEGRALRDRVESIAHGASRTERPRYGGIAAAIGGMFFRASGS
jgi:hypothetical protein